MFISESDDKIILAGTDAYNEAVASQEEIYLEETEEELRVILESDEPPPVASESLNQQQERAAEDLITGDSDDPPLSEDAVERMLSHDSQATTVKNTT